MTVSHKPTKCDILIIIVAFIFAALASFFIFQKRDVGNTARIIYDGGKLEYSLRESKSFTLTSGDIELCIKINDGGISVAESGCKDKTCVRTGPIKKIGETVICAPARLAILVVSSENGGKYADAVAG